MTDAPPVAAGAGPAITGVRWMLRDLMAAERAATDPRDVVVLAVDGVSYDVGTAAFRSADRVTELASVFPTVSAPNWISSITGRAVDDHGIPGVVFSAAPGGPPRMIFDQPAAAFAACRGNVFSDARSLGFDPVAVTCDLDAYPGAWHDAMIAGARAELGARIFTGGPPTAPHLLSVADASARVARVVGALWARRSSAPQLVWLYVELDRYLHVHGYDGPARQFLTDLDGLARDLSCAGAVVLAHADHGLVETRHDTDVAAMLEGASRWFDAPLGGAGRCRWFYAARDVEDDLVAALTRELPGDIRVERSADRFVPGGLAAGRVGSVLVIAEGEGFLNDAGSRFDHGSTRLEEVRIPLARWGELRQEAP